MFCWRQHHLWLQKPSLPGINRVQPVWSWHIRTSHVASAWVASHMNESRHIWMSHVTYEWARSRTSITKPSRNKSCIRGRHVAFACGTSHMNQSCLSMQEQHLRGINRVQEWVVSHLRGSRGGGLGSRPKKMYWERLGDGVEYHLMKPTPRR